MFPLVLVVSLHLLLMLPVVAHASQLVDVYLTQDTVGCNESCHSPAGSTHACQCPNGSFTISFRYFVYSTCGVAGCYGGQLNLCVDNMGDGYGGSYQEMSLANSYDTCNTPNPTTGSCTCGSGFTATLLYGAMECSPMIGGYYCLMHIGVCLKSSLHSGGLYQMGLYPTSTTAYSLYCSGNYASNGSCTCPRQYYPNSLGRSPTSCIVSSYAASTTTMCLPISSTKSQSISTSISTDAITSSSPSMSSSRPMTRDVTVSPTRRTPSLPYDSDSMSRKKKATEESPSSTLSKTPHNNNDSLTATHVDTYTPSCCSNTVSPSISVTRKSISVTTISHSNSSSSTVSSASTVSIPPSPSPSSSLWRPSVSVSFAAPTSTTSFSLDVDPLKPNALDVATQTTVAVVSIVSVASGGGDLSAAASMVLLSMASCREQQQQQQRSATTDSSKWIISPFWNLGGLWISVGNVSLVLVIGILHALVVKAKSVRERILFSVVATGVGRFPALSYMIADLFLPGVVLGAVTVIVANDGFSSSERALAVVLLSAVCIFTILSALFCQVLLIPRSVWVSYTNYPTAGAWDSVLYPSGRWAPKAMRNAFSPLFGSVTRRYAWLGSVDRVLALLLAALCGLQGSGACRSLLLLIAVLCFVRGLLFVILRPVRLPMNAVVLPVGCIVFGVVCVLKYQMQQQENDSTSVAAAVASLQIIQAVLQMWRMWWEMWMAYREAQWDLLSGSAGQEEGALSSSDVVSAVASAVWFGGGGGVLDVNASYLESLIADKDVDDSPQSVSEAPSVVISALMQENVVVDLLEMSNIETDVTALLTLTASEQQREGGNRGEEERDTSFCGIEGYFVVATRLLLYDPNCGAA